MKPFLSRAIAVGVGIASSKLAQYTGVVVDPATQASIVIAVYAGLHKLIEKALGSDKATRVGF
jgi:hypothetical protein